MPRIAAALSEKNFAALRRQVAIMVLLAHRTSSSADLKPWRRRFHRLVLGGREQSSK